MHGGKRRSCEESSHDELHPAEVQKNAKFEASTLHFSLCDNEVGRFDLVRRSGMHSLTEANE